MLLDVGTWSSTVHSCGLFYGLVVKQIDKQASAAKGPRDRRPRRSDLRALRCTIMNSAATAPLLYLAALLQSGVRWSGPSMTSRSDCRA